MWLKAVSSAPQNDEPSHTLAISASTPVLVVEPLISPSSESSVCSAAPGNTSPEVGQHTALHVAAAAAPGRR